MKKIIFIFVLIICFLSTPLLTYADYNNSNGNIIDGTPSANEDLADDKEIIAESSLNSLRILLEANSLDESAIDYNRASKGYYGMPIYDTDELTREQVQKFVKNAEVAYNVPIKYDESDEFGTITVAKGVEVTDEIRNNPDHSEHFIKRLEKQENRWCMASASKGDCEMDYNHAIYNLLEDYGIKNSYVYFINGIGDAGEIALVIFRENSDTAEFLLLDDEYAGDDGKVGLAPNTELGKRTYTYSELKQIDAQRAALIDPNAEVLLDGVDSDFNLDLSADSNYNLEYALIAGGVVLAVSAVAIIINFAMKKRAKV